MLIAGILAWTAFAFGGAYPLIVAPAAIMTLWLALAWRPPILGHGPVRLLDESLLIVLGVSAAHLVPLPQGFVWTVVPAGREAANALHLTPPAGPVPLSIDPPSTLGAVLTIGCAILLFFGARAVFETGGVRRIARTVAIVGLALAALAIAQDASGTRLMYWRWAPLQEGARPFGPFVNRNFFATWALMAVGLTIGYLTAHAAAHPGPAAHVNWRTKLVAWVDARAVLLLWSAALLILAIAASLSRSGLLGLVTALICGGELARRHEGGLLTRSARPAMLVVAAGSVAAFAVLTQVGPTAIAERIAVAHAAIADRVTIWRDTVPVLRDFWLTGTGVGTYATAMALYQRSNPGVLFNQAHNHYLQVAAEGGVVLLAPVLLALAAFARAAWRRLREDRSNMFWLRAGAASGLAGAAVQSLWDTGLTLPANAALAAVLAAIVVHTPGRAGRGHR